MKKIAAIIGLFAIVGVLPVTASAMSGVPTGQTRPQNPARAELERLREQLKKLQQELREQEAALRAARRSGDRIAAARHSAAIKRLKDEIAQLERRIRALGRGR